MKYRIIIEQGEGGMFAAECAALLGGVPQGKTRKEALRISRMPARAAYRA